MEHTERDFNEIPKIWLNILKVTEDFFAEERRRESLRYIFTSIVLLLTACGNLFGQPGLSVASDSRQAAAVYAAVIRQHDWPEEKTIVVNEKTVSAHELTPERAELMRQEAPAISKELIDLYRSADMAKVKPMPSRLPLEKDVAFVPFYGVVNVNYDASYSFSPVAFGPDSKTALVWAILYSGNMSGTRSVYFLTIDGSNWRVEEEFVIIWH